MSQSTRGTGRQRPSAGERLIAIARQLNRSTMRLSFGDPVRHVYAPLDYARAPAEEYLRRYGERGASILLVGMNPGPFGMAQTGVPFGDVTMARDWLGISGPVGQPEDPHPKRPVLGFAATRREVSGTRLYGWARARYETADRFFARHFVWNYCPLAFLEDSGRNRTPDQLPADERAALFEPCDAALRAVVDHLRPSWVLGVGRFAAERARSALPDFGGSLGEVPHPSPANPAANRGYGALLDRRFIELGLLGSD